MPACERRMVETYFSNKQWHYDTPHLVLLLQINHLYLMKAKKIEKKKRGGQRLSSCFSQVPYFSFSRSKYTVCQCHVERHLSIYLSDSPMFLLACPFASTSSLCRLFRFSEIALKFCFLEAQISYCCFSTLQSPINVQNWWGSGEIIMVCCKFFLEARYTAVTSNCQKAPFKHIVKSTGDSQLHRTFCVWEMVTLHASRWHWSVCIIQWRKPCYRDRLEGLTVSFFFVSCPLFHIALQPITAICLIDMPRPRF